MSNPVKCEHGVSYHIGLVDSGSGRRGNFSGRGRSGLDSATLLASAGQIGQHTGGGSRKGVLYAPLGPGNACALTWPWTRAPQATRSAPSSHESPATGDDVDEREGVDASPVSRSDFSFSFPRSCLVVKSLEF